MNRLMLPMSMNEIAGLIHGSVQSGDGKKIASGIAIDSRQVKRGDLFVAFHGQSMNGHEFVQAALSKGAVGALVTEDVKTDLPGCIVRVDHPLTAVQTLAHHDRSLFGGPVIGVTGSNGKTTTKDMLSLVFTVRGECLATQGNMNTELGLPLTLLRRSQSHRSIVLEMGMRGLGQIRELCDIANPTSGIITNIGQSHIELLGSQENIAQAKGELLEALPRDGYAALPATDPWLRKIHTRSQAQILWYAVSGDHFDGIETDSLFAFATDVENSPTGVSFVAHLLGESVKVFQPTHGRHNVRNAIGALSLGAAYGLPLDAMAQALSQLKPSAGRLNVVAGRNGVVVIDDCYNASPLSVRASLDVLSELGRDKVKVAILGDMLELGPIEEAAHRSVGDYVAELGIDFVLAIGERSRFTAEQARHGGGEVHYAKTREEATDMLSSVVRDNSVVLVKASRGAGLEKIVEHLVAP